MSLMSEAKKRRLREALAWAIGNPHSSFYRERFEYISHDLLTDPEASWHKVPLLVRNELMVTPFWQRVFLPRSRVETIRQTYGTSGKGVLISPKIRYGAYERPYARMKRLLCLFSAAHNDFPRTVFSDVYVMMGDVGNMDVTAKMATLARVDSLFIMPYAAIQFAGHLARYGSTGDITTVQLTGERCSSLQFRKICELYPNALVYSMYSSAETREVSAMPCEHALHEGRYMELRAVPEMLVEIVEKKTRAPIHASGVAGELVLTTLAVEIPFPLIRYAPGDLAQFVASPCGCEEAAFEVLGRTDVFPIRIAKGELTTESIERALSGIQDAESPYFEAHYYEESSTGYPRVHFVVVRPRSGISEGEAAGRIARDLRVFHGYTYADGVRAGLYAPLTVSFLDAMPVPPDKKAKPPRLVRHVADASEARGSPR